VNEFLVESGPIVDFLIELYPSRLTPQDGTPIENGVGRWRQRFFVDTFFSKVVPLLFKISGIGDREAQMKVVGEVVGHSTKELEPLLEDAAPYFGESKTLTVVEVKTRVPLYETLLTLAGDVYAVPHTGRGHVRRCHLAGRTAGAAKKPPKYREVDGGWVSAQQCVI
jgi:hypothetical protein